MDDDGDDVFWVVPASGASEWLTDELNRLFSAKVDEAHAENEDVAVMGIAMNEKHLVVWLRYTTRALTFGEMGPDDPLPANVLTPNPPMPDDLGPPPGPVMPAGPWVAPWKASE